MQKLILMIVFSVSMATNIGAIEPAIIIKTKCQACHGANMEKKALGKSQIVNTLNSDEIKSNLLGYKSGKLNQYGLGATMWGQIKPLTELEIEGLAKYIPTLKK